MSDTEIKDGTGNALIAFLDRSAQADWLTATTAKSYRASVSQVLQELTGGSDDFEHIDVRELDVESALTRFEATQKDRYTEGSMASYKTRFRRAVEMYLQFLDNPDSYEPGGQRRRPKIRGGRLGAEGVAKMRREMFEEQRRAADMVAPSVADEMIEYPFPLTDGGTALLRLPRNLIKADVDRLIAFLKSIAIDPRQPRLPLDVMPPQPD